MAPRRRRIIADMEADAARGREVALSRTRPPAVVVAPRAILHLQATQTLYVPSPDMLKSTAEAATSIRDVAGVTWLLPDQSLCPRARCNKPTFRMSRALLLTGEVQYKCSECSHGETYPLGTVGKAEVEGAVPTPLKIFTEAEAWRVVNECRDVLSRAVYNGYPSRAELYSNLTNAQMGTKSCEGLHPGDSCLCHAYCRCRLRGDCPLLPARVNDNAVSRQFQFHCPACGSTRKALFTGMYMVGLARPKYACSDCSQTSVVPYESPGAGPLVKV